MFYKLSRASSFPIHVLVSHIFTRVRHLVRVLFVCLSFRLCVYQSVYPFLNRYTFTSDTICYVCSGMNPRKILAISRSFPELATNVFFSVNRKYKHWCLLHHLFKLKCQNVRKNDVLNLWYIWHRCRSKRLTGFKTLKQYVTFNFLTLIVTWFTMKSREIMNTFSSTVSHYIEESLKE